MKTLERVLQKMTGENLPKTILAIQTQIEYLRVNNIDVDGISLVTVRDLLDEKFESKTLREDGYILTLKEFDCDAKKFLALAKENRVQYNSTLKSLHRSYQVLRDNYIQGQIFNQEVFNEMTEIFLDTIFSDYSSVFIEMPNPLNNRITKLIEAEVEKFNKNWHQSNLSEDLVQEFTTALAQRLLLNWSDSMLPKGIEEQLDHEKTKINDVKALMKHFLNVELPKEVQSTIQNHMMNDILTDIRANKLTVNSALGFEIAEVRSKTLAPGDFNYIEPIIKNWQNKKVSEGVAEQLDEYLNGVIASIQEELIGSMEDQFSELAVQSFLDKFRNGKYKNNVVDEMLEFMGNFSKENLIVSGLTKRENVSECQKSIHRAVMVSLHDLWVQCKLSDEENDYVVKHAFSSLDETAEKIESKIWANSVESESDNVKQENSLLKHQINDLFGVVNELKQRVNALEKKHSNKEENQAGNTNSVSSAGYGIFSARK